MKTDATWVNALGNNMDGMPLSSALIAGPRSNC